MQILLSGGTGRVGRELQQLIEADESLRLIATASSSDFFAGDDHGDVLIDFSRPESTARCVELAREREIALVIGTTGIEPALQARIELAAKSVPICQAANFSVGVNLLLGLVGRAAGSLPASFETEILELHHRWKVDAPSGTALALGREIAKARGQDHDSVAAIRGAGAREPGGIGYQVARGGDVAGEHTVMFIGDGERLELTHRSGDRAVFARGALHAARWLVGRPPGLYSMHDVLA